MRYPSFSSLTWLPVVLCGISLANGSQAQAATVLLGIDENDSNTIRLTSTPNTDTQRALFLSALSGVGNENFEGFTTGAVNGKTSTFPGSTVSLVATFSGSGDVLSIPTGTNGNGAYPTSGSKYLSLQTGSGFTLNFNTPIAAFGFTGTDVGDVGSTLRLTFGLAGGGTLIQEIAPSSTGRNGSVLFFGLLGGVGETFTSVQFSGVGGGDNFGFDDFVIGDAQQVVNPLVPEPEVLPGLLMFGLFGASTMFVARNRRMSQV